MNDRPTFRGDGPIPPLGVRQAYALWADEYDRTPNPVLALEKRCLDAMLPPVAGKVVADLGCGTGRWLDRLSSASTYLGVDASHEMLRRARPAPGRRSYLMQADAGALPLRSHSVDVVLASFLVGYMSPAALAGEVARISRDADVYISDFHPEAYANGWKRNVRLAGRTIELQAREVSANDIAAAFRPHGFAPEKMTEHSFDEPERAIFAACGKAESFDSLRRVRALFICHLKRSV